MTGQKGMVGNRHLPRCWGQSGARRVGRQSQQGQVSRTSTVVQGAMLGLRTVTTPKSWLCYTPSAGPGDPSAQRESSAAQPAPREATQE